MVVVSLKTGKVVAGRLRPSSDTPTHLFLYRNFKNVGGIAHTHVVNANVVAKVSGLEKLGALTSMREAGATTAMRVRCSDMSSKYHLSLVERSKFAERKFRVRST